MEPDRAAAVPQAGQPTLRLAAAADRIEFLSNCRSRSRRLVAGFLLRVCWGRLRDEASAIPIKENKYTLKYKEVF